jgi:hypothetical protein
MTCEQTRDNAYLDEGLITLAEGRNRLNNNDTDIEGELSELVAFSAKRRLKLSDVLNQRDLDQVDYLRLAEVRWVVSLLIMMT